MIFSNKPWSDADLLHAVNNDDPMWRVTPLTSVLLAASFLLGLIWGVL